MSRGRQGLENVLHIPNQGHPPPTVEGDTDYVAVGIDVSKESRFNRLRFCLCVCVCPCLCLSLSLVKAEVKVDVEGRVEVTLGRDAEISCMYTTDDGIGGLTIEWFYVSF